MVAGFERIDAFVNNAVCRIGHGFVEHAAFDAVFAERARDAFGIAVFHHEFVGDDERSPGIAGLGENVGNVFNAAASNLEKTWNTDSNCLSHSFPQSTLTRRHCDRICRLIRCRNTSDDVNGMSIK